MASIAAPDVASSTYDTFAAYYDRYTEHPLYERWIVGVEHLARGFGLQGIRFLDVACGTGKSLLPYLERGYDVTGCDIAPAMLNEARRKCAGRARLVEADAADLPILGAFDLITALNDVVNYQLDADALSAFLRGAAANLRPGGLFIFDASTLVPYRTTFARAHVRACSDALFAWRGETEADFAPGGLARGTLDAFLDDGDGRWTRSTLTDVQRHHPLARVRAAIADAGLTCLAELGQQDDGTRDPTADEAVHLKALYVTRSATA